MWTTAHAALLQALRANRVVPGLYRRLASEQFGLERGGVEALRHWARSLRSDPAWRVLEPAVDEAAAWPDVWDRAVEAGFAPVTDHHNALVLQEIASRHAQQNRWEDAEWAFRRALDAWARVYSTDYPAALLRDLAPDEAALPAAKAAVRRLLADQLEPIRRHALEAAGLEPKSDAPTVQRGRLVFVWRVLEQCAGYAGLEDPSGALAELMEEARDIRAEVSAGVLLRFQALVDELDLGGQGSLAGPFAWVGDFYSVVPMTQTAAVTVVAELVTMAWTVRRLETNRAAITPLLSMCVPFNEELERLLSSDDSVFGHNSRCADFLVFQGELEDEDDVRRDYFERGLRVCPGHRNSRMLLAYVLVRDAEAALSRADGVTGFGAKLGLRRDSLEREMNEAERKLERAESLYPELETLEAARERFDSLRSKIGFPADKGETP